MRCFYSEKIYFDLHYVCYVVFLFLFLFHFFKMFFFFTKHSSDYVRCCQSINELSCGLDE